MSTNTKLAQAAGQKQYTREQHFALREAHCIAAGDAYFEVRPHLTAFGPHRLTFDAGFVRGFDKATELADERALAAGQQAQVPAHGWTDADADAARLALELECLLTDKDMPTATVSRWWDSAHEALRLHRQRLASEQSHGMNRRMAALREALAAHESAAEPARLTDEQRIDWLCEEAVYHCGQWQVVFDSDKDSFIDAIDEMAAIAHGIGAATGEQHG